MSSAPPPPRIIMVGGGNRPAPASTNTIPAWAWVLVAIIIIGFGILIALKWKGQTCTPKDSDKVANANTYVYNKTSFVSNCVVSNCLDGYNLLNGICSQVIDDPGTTPAPAADPGTVPSDGTDPGTVPSDGTVSAETKCTSQKATGNIQGWAYDSTKGCTIQCNSGFTGTNCENGPDDGGGDNSGANDTGSGGLPSVPPTTPTEMLMKLYGKINSSDNQNLSYGDYITGDNLYDDGTYVTFDAPRYVPKSKIIVVVPVTRGTTGTVKTTDDVMIIDYMTRLLFPSTDYIVGLSKNNFVKYDNNTDYSDTTNDTYKFKLSLSADKNTLTLTPKDTTKNPYTINNPRIFIDNNGISIAYPFTYPTGFSTSAFNLINNTCTTTTAGLIIDAMGEKTNSPIRISGTIQETINSCAKMCSGARGKHASCNGFEINRQGDGADCYLYPDVTEIKPDDFSDLNLYTTGRICYKKN